MAAVPIVKTDSVIDQLERMHRRIAVRAYSLSKGRSPAASDPLRDWLAAEDEVIWKPAVEVRELDGTLTVLAALPGVAPEDIEVDVSPTDVVVKAETRHEHTADKGRVHTCEFVAGEAFRSVHLPAAIDVAGVKADYRHGMLRVTAPLAPPARPRRVQAPVA